MTTEEVVESAYNGGIISKGSWDYHIPGSADIPIKFNVTLMPGMRNPRGVLDSKAVAEPPSVPKHRECCKYCLSVFSFDVCLWCT